MQKKIFLVVPLLFVFLMSAVYGQGRPQSLSDEASAFMTKFWQAQVSVCGTSYYSKNFTEAPKSRRRALGYTEWKSYAFSLHERPLSTAEQLNGVQWKGVTYLSVSAYRMTDGLNGDWGSWAPGFEHSPETQISKINGKWQITMTYNVLTGYISEAVPCEEIAARRQSKAAPARR